MIAFSRRFFFFAVMFIVAEGVFRSLIWGSDVLMTIDELLIFTAEAVTEHRAVKVLQSA